MRRIIDPQMRGPIITAVLLVSLSAAILVWLSGLFSAEDSFLSLLLLIPVIICIAVAVCAVAALWKRKRELDSGEEEEAKKY